MQIKRFEAVSVQEALQKVKSSLGPEAIILYTKKLKRGGLFGWMGTEMVEVTAGVDVPVLEADDFRPAVETRLQLKKNPKQSGQEDDNPKKETQSRGYARLSQEKRSEVFQSELN